MRPERALSPEQDAARRLSAILDYVAADYPRVLGASGVTDPGEYAEQVSFLRDARDVARELSPAGGWLPAAVARISEQVSDTARGTEVAEAARGVRTRLLEEYGVRLAPATRPSRAVGARVYAASCTVCHGARGAGDGVAAAGMVPRPANFLDARVAADLSPARAFNMITDGVAGTPMPSFGMLSAQERWSVAFYVLSLGRGGREAEDAVRSASVAGRPPAASGAASPAPGSRETDVRIPEGLLGRDTLAVLAAASDRELDARLARAGLPPEERARALAALRAEVPFREGGGGDLRPVMTALDRAVQVYDAGDPAAARAALTAAYLDGVEPVEPTLRARDPVLVARIERGFMTLRDRSREGVSSSAFANEAMELRDLVSSAQAHLSVGEHRAMPFMAAGLILVREGLESALLISLLLGLVRQAGERRDVVVAHAGWVSALALGALTWFASGWVIRMGGARREVVEGGVTLLAAAVLVYAGHFVLARADAGRRVRNLRARILSSSTSGRFLMLFGLAFVAVYREAFEVVLFLQAVLVQSPGSGWMVLGGALAGLAVCAVLAFGIIRAGMRLKPGIVLSGTGTLLCALAVVMVGKGFHALQEAGIVGLRYVAVPRIDWLGVYPTVQTLGSQALVLTAIVALAVMANLRTRTELAASE